MRLSSLVILAVALLVMACSGGPAGEGRPAADISGASGAPERGLILYRDTFGTTIVAQDVDTGQQFRLQLPAGAGFPVAADCRRDGRTAAYLTVDFTANVSRLSVIGEGAPQGALEIEGVGQGMAWAPDGKRIALSKFDPGATSNTLWLLDLADGELTPLPSAGSPSPPRWSAEGERLVFSGLEGSLSQLFVLEIGASAPVKLTDRSESAFDPDWSPDGRTLLFSGPDNSGLSQLFAIDADGTNERQVTISDTSKAAPRWSVDGSLIAFAGTISVPQVSRSPASLHNLAVWVVNADGSDERAITDVAADAWPLGWCLPGPWLEEGWVEG